MSTNEWEALNENGHLIEYRILRWKADGVPVLAATGTHSALCGTCEPPRVKWCYCHCNARLRCTCGVECPESSHRQG